jgi:hypothetical protein
MVASAKAHLGLDAQHGGIALGRGMKARMDVAHPGYGNGFIVLLPRLVPVLLGHLLPTILHAGVMGQHRLQGCFVKVCLGYISHHLVGLLPVAVVGQVIQLGYQQLLLGFGAWAQGYL